MGLDARALGPSVQLIARSDDPEWHLITAEVHNDTVIRSLGHGFWSEPVRSRFCPNGQAPEWFENCRENKRRYGLVAVGLSRAALQSEPATNPKQERPKPNRTIDKGERTSTGSG